MKRLIAADLFCGAGGTSAGLIEACQELGYNVELTAINHWEVAIATHTKNHPGARHKCASLDSLNPRHLYGEEELDILWASPECTHHSVARGGKPVSDQSRATAWCVARWAEALRPKIILIENVPEFEDWGPLITRRMKIKIKVPALSYSKWLREQRSKFAKKNVSVTKKELSRSLWKKCVKYDEREVLRNALIPNPKRKGEIFRAWVKSLESFGYKVSHRVFCAADYGDPTTRRRLFVQAVRGNRKIVWPNRTHAPADEISKGDMFDTDLQPYATAKDDVIDWSIEGKSIFSRKRPLADKTMERIWIGLQKFGLAPFVVGAGGPEYSAKPASVDRPLGTVLCENRKHLVNPFLVKMRGTNDAAPIDDPVPTVTAGGNHIGVAEPFLVEVAHGNKTKKDNKRRVKSVKEPLGAVTGSPNVALAQPYLVNMKGQSDAASVNEPTPSVTAHAPHLYLAEPQLYRVRCKACDFKGERSTEERNFAECPECGAPAGLVTNGKPYLVQVNHGKTTDKNHESRVKSVENPLPTVAGNRGEFALLQPFIVPQQQGDGKLVDSVDRPLRTVTTTSRGMGLAQPFVMAIDQKGKKGKATAPAASGTDEPISTVTTKQRHALVEPILVQTDQTGSNGCCSRPVTEPMPTVTCRKNFAVAQPYLVEYYGNGVPQSVDDPLGTVTTKPRFGLCLPKIEINGETYLLDIHFRMLSWRELARAQGFTDDYEFTGTTTQIVKQIGNAVPRRLARALVTAAVTQNAMISASCTASRKATEEISKSVRNQTMNKK